MNGFIRADGKRLLDGSGRPFQIRGVNLGNWLVPECYMALADVGNFETGRYTIERGLRAMRANPNLTDEQIAELERIYVENYITEEDFRRIAEVGLNTVRLPFMWRTLTTDGITPREDAFDVLDRALSMCEKYGLYAILDHHGAIGSQNMDFHSGNDEQLGLYGSPEYKGKTIAMWKMIAERYRGREVVLGYDLLNECRVAPGKFGGRLTTDFYFELYQAVRSVDPEHLIFIEYFTFPIHGRGMKHYPWKNVAASYHIYNLTPFSQLVCLHFVRAMHLISGNAGFPVYIGEFNAWNKVEDWKATFDFFEKYGWSWTSWTYKANEYPYHHVPEFAERHEGRDWGLFVLNAKPVNLLTATFEEIAEAYRAGRTERARKTYICEVMEERFRER